VAETGALLSEVEAIGLPEFFAFLHAHRLDQLWREYLASARVAATDAAPQPLAAALAPYLRALDERAMRLAARNLQEKVHLRAVHQLLEAAEIPYFIFKGAQLRHTLYPVPTLRSACDIDLFVPQTRRKTAIDRLVGAGFELHVEPRNASHEVSLTRGATHIDLHWHLMRPGRTRIDLGDHLFANRATFGEGLHGLDLPAGLLVALIHPAFTKHLASPRSMLIHLVDLHRLLERATATWDDDAWRRLIDILDRSGMRTAAWSSLYVLARCRGASGPDRLAARLRPGRLHRRYLEAWIDRDLIRRWFHRRFVIRAGFSLALQDSLTDAARAVVRKATPPALGREPAENVSAETSAR